MIAVLALFAAVQAAPPPIIDMHFHAMAADSMGPPGSSICAPYEGWPVRDPAKPIEAYLGEFTIAPPCRNRFVGRASDSEVRDRSLEVLRRRNITAVTSGTADLVEEFRRSAPDHVIPAISFGDGALPSIAELRSFHKAGRLKVIGELTFH